MNIEHRALRLTDLPWMWYARNYVVRREALQKFPTPWWWLLKWYWTTQRTHRASWIILADGTRVGYCFLTMSGDIGIYIPLKKYQSRGVGTMMVETLIREARHRGLIRVTCGTDMPEWAKKFGFREEGPAVLDHGVWRHPMGMFL